MREAKGKNEMLVITITMAFRFVNEPLISNTVDENGSAIVG